MATSLPIRILVAALSWLTTLLGSGDDMIICALCALLLLLFYLFVCGAGEKAGTKLPFMHSQNKIMLQR